MRKRLLAAAAAGLDKNYYGNGELGDCQFGTSGITQSGNTVDIDTKLTTGSKAGGPGASSYGSGNNAPPGSNVYELTVPSKNGSYDGDMVVAQFNDLTIDASVWLTVDQPCRGLLVYVKGDCVINGTLGMTCRGAYADPTASGGSDNSAVNASGIQLPIRKAGGTDTLSAAVFDGCGSPAVNAVANQTGIDGNGTIFSIARAGASGGNSVSGNSVGNAGSNGATNQSGGGGSGSCYTSGPVSVSGGGGDGTCFSGGTGGGGSTATSVSSYAGNGDDTGGQGGEGALNGNQNYSTLRGAGNPGAKNGTGGLMFLVVKGDLSGSGSIQAKGTWGDFHATQQPAPGSSGGGNITALYAGANTFSGVVSAAGGDASIGGGYNSGKGGDGCVQGPTQIDR